MTTTLARPAAALAALAALAACGDDAASPATPDAGPENAWRCPATPAEAPAPPIAGAWLEDATASIGVDPASTTGFGRPVVVDLDGDGLDDLVALRAHDGAHGRSPWDKLVLRQRPGGGFEDFAAASGLAALEAGLLVFADVDGDGDQDLFAGVIEAHAREQRGLWRNDGAGRFTHEPEAVPALGTSPCGERTCVPAEIGATFLDAEGDGDLDLYVGGWFWSDGVTDTRYNPPPRDVFYRNDGTGRFTDASADLPPQNHPRTNVSSRFGRATMGASAGDYDGDGDLDLFLANYGAGRPPLRVGGTLTCSPPRYWDQNLLYRNDRGSFVDVSDAAGVAATPRGPAGVLEEPTLVMGEECPAEVRGTYPGPIGGNSFTSQFGDFDNDGDLDLVVGSIAHPDYVQSDPTVLLVNGGAASGFTFTEEGYARGLEWREDEKHAVWVDLDADGLLDLVTTGFRDAETNGLRVYHQTEEHRFVRLDEATSGVADPHQEGLALLDVDADGDLDVWIAEDAEPAKLLRNRAADGRGTLTLRLEATAPRDATGARVTLRTRAGTQTREVTAGNGHYNMQPTRAVHFGLGGDDCAADVTVRWPDGTSTSLGAVRAGVALRVVQPDTVTPIAR